MFPILLAAVVMDEIPRNALRYRNELTREARFVYGLLAPVPMFGGQIHQESSWNPDAQSKFASGLAQFTPQTADWINGLYKLGDPATGKPLPTNPTWAIRALLRYDQRLRDSVGVASTDCDKWSFALSAYNGGMGRVQARQRLSKVPGDYTATRIINPGISVSNQAENENYPIRILYRWQPVYLPWGTVQVCKEK